MKKKLKKLIKMEIKGQELNELKYIGTGLLFFFTIEVFIRFPAIHNSNYYNMFMSASPILFTLFYTSLFLFLFYILPKKIDKVVYWILNSSMIILMIINYFLLKLKNVPISISILSFAKEGAQYKGMVLKEIRFIFVLILLILIGILIWNYHYFKKLKKEKKTNWKKILVMILMIIGLYIASRESLYYNISKENYNNAFNYYENHSTYANAVVALGIYEYMARDVYFSFHKNNIDASVEREKELEEKYYRVKEDNPYTGIYKDKNLIMIMMESIDERVAKEPAMPTFTKLRKESLNFTRRYSYVARGGSTLYSEFDSLTGLFYDYNYHEILENSHFTDSLPNVFRKNGYHTTSMHENTGDYYKRNILHPILGFDNSYFLMDISEDTIPFMDPQIADNDEFYEKIVSKDHKFMSFITTMSGHGPYDEANNPQCVGTKSELDCFQMLARRTDDLLDHLIKRLEEDDLLEDTVFVIFADHNSYTYPLQESDLNIISTPDNEHMVRSIPFIIYHVNGKGEDISTFLNDCDILPTILNLFGLEYDPNTYVGNDVFSKDHRNLMIMEDYSWYDGKTYSPYSSPLKVSDYKEKEKYVADTIYRSELILSYKYYDYK